MVKKTERILTFDDFNDYYDDVSILGIVFGGMIAFVILVISSVLIVDYLKEILLLLTATIVATEGASYFILKRIKKSNDITKTSFGATIVIKLFGVIWSFMIMVALFVIGVIIGLLIECLTLFINYININGKLAILYFLGTIFVITIYIIVIKINHEWYNKYLKR